VGKGPHAKFSDSQRHYQTLRAIAASDLTPTERLVLVMVETHVTYKDRNTGKCCPSLATLADATGLDRRSVYRVTGRLEEIGWLEITRRIPDGDQTSNVYRVTPPDELLMRLEGKRRGVKLVRDSAVPRGLSPKLLSKTSGRDADRDDAGALSGVAVIAEVLEVVGGV
jgi:DNA-binding MarR family transcriptional regulator